MPRAGGNGVYSVPPGTDGVPDQTVESARYNAFAHDVETDLNAPRPIAYGGTGANNALDAMTALGGEIANQIVTNYDTFPFQSGTFASGPGATSSPEGAAPAVAYFEGICYSTAPGYINFYIEARNLNTNVKYYRRKLSGVWQPWVLDLQAALDASNALDAAKVNRAGDTMTGSLIIQSTLPELRMVVTGAPYLAAISSVMGPNARWQMQLIDGAAEGGGNSGSNFLIARYNDAGSYADTPLTITRSNGHLVSNGYVPSAANDLVNKAYVDATAATGATGLAGKVSKSGDTMTGDLTIADANPAIVFNKSTGGGTNLYAVTAGTLRWAFSLSNTSTESGGNAGSDYSITRYADNGSGIDTPFLINRATGNVGIGTATPGYKLEVNGAIKANSIIANVDYSYIGANLQTRPTNAYAVGAIGWNYSTQEVGFWNTYTGGGTNSFAFRQLTSGGAAHTDLMTISQTGNLTVAGTITANGVVNKALAGQSPLFQLQDETGALKGYLGWDRATGSINLTNQSTPSAGISLDTTAKVKLGVGMFGRAGTNGAYDGNAHNFFWTGTAGQMWIDVTNFGNIQTVCDYRIKKDVVPLSSCWEQVKALKPISYTHQEFTPPSSIAAYAASKAKATKENLPPPDPLTPLFTGDDIPQWGFLAHELQEALLPSAAHGEKDSPTDIQTPNTLAIIAALTRALQEAMTRIEALEARP